MFYATIQNHPEVQLELLERLGCNTIVVPKQMHDTARMVLQKRPMVNIELPSLDYFLHADDVPSHPYNKTWDEARTDPWLVLHSSGSTGTPKLLVLTHGTAAVMDAYQRLPELGDEPWYGQQWVRRRVFMSFPWIHAAGQMTLACAIYLSFTIVTPPSWPLTAPTADYFHVHGNVQAGFYTPSVLQGIARDPAYLQNISRLKCVSFAGGILHANAGDAIAARTRLFGIFGATETAILPGQVPPPADWNYYCFNPRLGHVFEPVVDDMFELVYVRNAELADYQGIFHTFPELDRYSTRDLYVQHPTRPGWWRAAGRVDDVIVLADAKKLNPLPYEAAVETIPAIATALVCGRGRAKPALLVEPREWPEDSAAEERLREEIRRRLDFVNSAGPVHGNLSPELVVLSRREKPMARAGGKNTVQRQRSVEMYKEEIEAAYARTEMMGLM